MPAAEFKARTQPGGGHGPPYEFAGREEEQANRSAAIVCNQTKTVYIYSVQSASPDIEALLGQAAGQLWRGRPDTTGHKATLSTGHEALDSALPGGGWPQGVVTELLLQQPANGELRVLFPVMKALGQSGHWLSWINPPAIPYAPALAQAGLNLARNLWLPELKPESAWWAMEQLVQHSHSGLVIAWLEPLHRHAIRRLQLAVETGGGMAVLCRQAAAQKQPSAAALRLILEPQNNGLNITILKSRNSLRRQVIKLL